MLVSTGVLVVDYPPEESVEFAQAMHANALDPIFLLAPTSTASRIAQVAELASGYVYYVSLKGVTGSAALDVQSVAARIPEIHAANRCPRWCRFWHPRRDNGRRSGESRRCGRGRQPDHRGNRAIDE